MINRDNFYYGTFCALFWIASTIGFVTQELLPFLCEFGRMMFLGVDVLMLLLGLAMFRGKREVWMAVIFMAIAYITTVILNGYTLFWFINGCREFMPMIFMWVIVRYIYMCPESERYRNSFDHQLRIFLWVQAVCVTEQFIRYGAGDYGGGSMGLGYSGGVSLIIIMLVYYFMSRNWDSDAYLKSIWRNRVYVFLLYPVFLNETKVSFVVIFLMFLCLYKWNWRSVGKFIMALPVFVLVMFGMKNAYLAATGQDDDALSEETINDYLNGEDVDFLIESAEAVANEEAESADVLFLSTDLPRFAKIGMLPFILEPTPGGLMMGAGVGQFKGRSTLEPTEFYKQNSIVLEGTNFTLLYMVSQLGLVGLLWYIIWMAGTLKYRKRNSQMALQTKIFLTLLTVLVAFYFPAFYVVAFTTIFYWISCYAIYGPTKSETEEKRISAAAEHHYNLIE